MSYSIVIIDDESPAITVIKTYLKKYDQLKVVAECQNGFDGLKAIQQFSPDLIFLDIQMPKLNGFELLEILDDPPQVIFSTAYDEYALKAFDINAVDYLLKPYSEERFQKAVEKAILNLSQGTPENKLDRLKSHLARETETISRIVVKTGPNIRALYPPEVKYLEAQDDYVMIYTETGKFLKQQTMKFYEENLDQNDFFRVHRSYIVNIDFIARLEPYEKSGYRIFLKSGEKLPVSRGGYQRLKERLNF